MAPGSDRYPQAALSRSLVTWCSPFLLLCIPTALNSASNAPPIGRTERPPLPLRRQPRGQYRLCRRFAQEEQSRALLSSVTSMSRVKLLNLLGFPNDISTRIALR